MFWFLWLLEILSFTLVLFRVIIVYIEYENCLWELIIFGLGLGVLVTMKVKVVTSNL